jgi:Gp5 N-terminal OB domain
MMPSFFFAEVVSVTDDEEMIGRMKIRVLSDQDDEGRIPDSELRWARPITSSHDAPQYAGVGRGGTGILPGTTVFGFFTDADLQHPFIVGAVPTAGKSNSLPRQTGAMPSGREVSAGNPLSGIGPRQRTERRMPPVQDLQPHTTERFFMGSSGNGPPSYGLETNILASVTPRGVTADITAFVGRVNPNNIGGIGATITGLSSVVNYYAGLPSRILGQAIFAVQSVISNVINIAVSNVMGAISTVISAVGNLLATNVIDPINQLIGSLASIPLNPLQQLAFNLAVGASATGNPAALLNLAAQIRTSSQEELGMVAIELTRIGGMSLGTEVALTRMARASDVSAQIASVASFANIPAGGVDPAIETEDQTAAYAQLKSLALEAGDVLGVGTRLVELYRDPYALQAEIDSIATNSA